jgi:hypothetical protein
MTGTNFRHIRSLKAPNKNYINRNKIVHWKNWNLAVKKVNQRRGSSKGLKAPLHKNNLGIGRKGGVHLLAVALREVDDEAPCGRKRHERPGAGVPQLRVDRRRLLLPCTPRPTTSVTVTKARPFSLLKKTRGIKCAQLHRLPGTWPPHAAGDCRGGRL